MPLRYRDYGVIISTEGRMRGWHKWVYPISLTL